MTSTDISSEESSEFYGGRRRRNSRGISSKVDNLASKLHETNSTLKVVDKMLGEYKGMGEQQTLNVAKLRDDLQRTTDRLQDERVHRSLRESARSLRPSDLDEDFPRGRRRRGGPTSPLRDYDHAASDVEHDRRSRRSLRGAVRFFDDMDTNGHKHTIHQSLRDLTSGQLRMEDEFNREIDRRTRSDIEHRRSLSDLRQSAPQPVTSVDRRLQSIQDELRAERAALRKRQDEVGKISSELKEALQQQKSTPHPTTPVPGQDDLEIRTRLVQTEAQKSQVESELENIRRRLDQAEGGRDALLDQTEDLRHELSRSEQEKQRLHGLIEQQETDLHDRRKRRSVDEYERDQFEAERRRTQEEVRELRAQISKSASVVGDYGDLRRELERSEKQRTQLSDHIQVLNKDLEEKEKQSVRAMAQLQELTSRYHDADHQSASSLTQLEDALHRLRDASQSAETLAVQLKEAQRHLSESERKRDEIKNRAQETVRQWKVKCKKLERELDKHQQTTRVATERNTSLGKEVETLRGATSSGGQQMELMKRQMSELLAMRAQMDEQLRIRDIEVNELKSLKMDLERDLRDCKVVIERLEHELRMANEKTSAIFDERNKLEDQVGSLQTANMMVQNQLQQLQNELRQVNFEKVEVTTHLAEVAGERNEVKAIVSDLRRSEAAAREEVEQLASKLKEEKDQFISRVESMKAEIEQYKARESHIVNEMSRRYKKEQAEYEAEVQALRLEVQEERSGNKLQRKQQEKLKAEIDRLHQELLVSQEETAAGRRKYHKIKEEILARAQMTEDGLSSNIKERRRVKEMELHLLDTKDTLLHVEKDYQNILYSIGVEVDAVVEVAALDCLDTYKALTPIKALPNEPQKWFAEMKGKLGWLRAELRERHHVEKRLRSNVRDAMETTTKDHTYYVNELQRQTDAMEALHKQEQAERELENTNNFITHQEPAGELFDTAALERHLPFHLSFLADQEKHAIIEDIELQETKKERDRIHERYVKLQETMSSLRQELTASHSADMAEVGVSGESSQEGRRYQVRSATPPVHDMPSLNSKRMGVQTPPPLSLTDEEFNAHFVQHSPILREKLVA